LRCFWDAPLPVTRPTAAASTTAAVSPTLAAYCRGVLALWRRANRQWSWSQERVSGLLRTPLLRAWWLHNQLARRLSLALNPAEGDFSPRDVVLPPALYRPYAREPYPATAQLPANHFMLCLARNQRLDARARITELLVAADAQVSPASPVAQAVQACTEGSVSALAGVWRFLAPHPRDVPVSGAPVAEDFADLARVFLDPSDSHN